MGIGMYICSGHEGRGLGMLPWRPLCDGGGGDDE